MAETAVRLVDHVFPRLPVHQWVLSLPKRQRYFLQREPAEVNAVLHISLCTSLRRHCERTVPVPAGARMYPWW